MMTISLPDDIGRKIQSRAEAEGISVNALVTDLVLQALEAEDDLTLEEFVARIQAMPPNPASVRPAQGSLLAALQSKPIDSDFDQATWEKEWAAAEAELKALDRADDVAEGRR